MSGKTELLAKLLATKGWRKTGSSDTAMFLIGDYSLLAIVKDEHTILVKAMNLQDDSDAPDASTTIKVTDNHTDRRHIVKWHPHDAIMEWFKTIVE